mmetsp:Transcript_6351/g.8979  ORF Transcript_6351/g.8979 Transcript_6351/m.8979 type:complete len:314 (+) Transcript_6351:3-944(+)
MVPDLNKEIGKGSQVNYHMNKSNHHGSLSLTVILYHVVTLFCCLSIVDSFSVMVHPSNYNTRRTTITSFHYNNNNPPRTTMPLDSPSNQKKKRKISRRTLALRSANENNNEVVTSSSSTEKTIRKIVLLLPSSFDNDNSLFQRSSSSSSPTTTTALSTSLEEAVQEIIETMDCTNASIQITSTKCQLFPKDEYDIVENACLSSNALIALAPTSPSDVKFVATMFRLRRTATGGSQQQQKQQYQCQFALGGKPFAPLVGYYDGANPQPLLEDIVPFTKQAKSKKLAISMQELFEKWTIQDFNEALLLFFNQQEN